MSQKKESKSLDGWLRSDRAKRREEMRRQAALAKLGEMVLLSRNMLAERYPLGFEPSLGCEVETHIRTLGLLPKAEAK